MEINDFMNKKLKCLWILIPLNIFINSFFFNLVSTVSKRNRWGVFQVSISWHPAHSRAEGLKWRDSIEFLYKNDKTYISYRFLWYFMCRAGCHEIKPWNTPPCPSGYGTALTRRVDRGSWDRVETSLCIRHQPSLPIISRTAPVFIRFLYTISWPPVFPLVD